MERYAIEGKFKHFTAKDGITNDLILSLFEDRQHTIWIGTDRGVFLSNGDRFNPLNRELGIPARTAYTIFQDSRGSMWIGGTTLHRVADGTAREFHLDSKIGNPHVRSIVEGDDGLIWVGTNLGLYRFDRDGRFQQVPEISGNVRVLRRTSDSSIWIGTVGAGMWVFRSASKIPEHFQQSFSSKVILSLDEDVQTNIWVGTRAGLVRLSRTPVSIVPVADASSSDFGSMMRDSDGTIWMCSSQLLRMHNGTFERYDIPALRGMRIRTLTRDRDGSLWVGTEGNGLQHLSRDGRALDNYSHRLVSNDIRAVLQARDATLWIGTDSGVSHLTKQGVSNQRSVNGHGAYVMSMLEDHGGDIWVGTYYGLLHLSKGLPVEDEITQAMRQVNIWSLHESGDGTLWIGTNDGLYIIKGSSFQHLNQAQGIPASPIYQILESATEQIWLSSPSGIATFNRRSLDSVGVAKKPQLALTYFPVSEDFDPAELFGSIGSAGIITPDGNVWFPSTRGGVHILSNTPEEIHPFPFKITQVLVDGKASPFDGRIILPASSSALAIDYAPILLSSQSAMRFRVRLEGFDKDWQDVSTRRTAYYTNLPPGHFTFHVAAYKTGSVTNIQETSLVIVKLAPLYRRPWFILLSLVFACVVAVGGYRIRLRRLHSRFRFVLEERNRVAREMHDTVIQGCTTISALLEAAAGMRGSDDNSSHELHELARQQIQTTIIEARQAVWNLRHGVPLHDNFEAAIAKVVEDANHESTVQVVFRQTGDSFPITPAVSHELLMTIREAIRNAIAHAHSDLVSVEVSFRSEDLELVVRDSGIGFDTKADRNDASHFGLQGMRERMRRVGAALEIDSAFHVGTSVSIKVNAASCRSDFPIGKV